ncbi:hypothetical protein ACFE04_010751 [Oxalis oulophora]
MVSICGLFLFYTYTLMVTLFSFVNRVFLRVKGKKGYQINNNNKILSKLALHENKQGNETEETESANVRLDTKTNIDTNEEGSPNFFVKFQFQRYEDFTNKSRENEDDHIGLNSGPSTSSNKYEFESREDFRCFVEKPEVFSFRVNDLYVDSNNGCLRESLCKDENLEAEDDHELELLNSVNAADKYNDEVFTEDSRFAEDKPVGVEKCFRIDAVFDSDSDSICEMSLFSPQLDSISDDFSSENDSEIAFELENLIRNTEEKRELIEEYLENLSSGYEADDFDVEDSTSSHSGSDINLSDTEMKHEENCINSDNPISNEISLARDSEDSSKLEILWEHQDLMEQLKTEIKKVRATGLPTILEEDESPKIMMEDLKPWKIDEKFQHADAISELHKFYRSYRERMRKFDILNYQKMYAIGVLQSKDSLNSITSSNSSFQPLFQTFKLRKSKSKESDPTIKFIRELHRDLEVVYVGQMCLSWEILHWQYNKALKLWESDRYGTLIYNEVAGEFQQFQVLMQRFIENEPFEGPRVQNYVQNRCVLRNLNQVPVIKGESDLFLSANSLVGILRTVTNKKLDCSVEDDTKNKRKTKKSDAITSDMLVEIIEESIRLFWKFVKADKDSNTPKSGKGRQLENLDPEDLELFADIQASLQKKEKRLKEILRSGNCILRKFQKREEEGLDQVLYFFSQVDMKLVARVLNMSTITRDQLSWCNNKLSKISFVDRKLHVEPSFSLFPC